jgi:hypothetical protein
MSEESAFNNNSVEDSANSDANISGTEEDTSSSSIQESYRINDSESDDDDELDDDDYSQSQDLLEVRRARMAYILHPFCISHSLECGTNLYIKI